MQVLRPLYPETLKLLERIYHKSRKHQVRQRAHFLLLVAKGMRLSQLLEIFSVSHKTLYNWLKAWDRYGLIGLYNRPGQGRKPLFTYEQKKQIKEWAKETPNTLNRVLDKIKETWNIVASKETLKRILKEMGMTWRRVRRVVGGVPDSQEYEEKSKALEDLKRLDEQGEIDLRYFDESGFCMAPYVPYAWQELGQTIELESKRGSKRLNVVGLMNRNNELTAYTFECRIDSQIIIACIEAFCQEREACGETRKAVIVMDKASIHTSKKMNEKQREWLSRGVEIFLLPSYSPELNLIEILWRFMKYEWIEMSAYKSWTNLVEYVNKVLEGFGSGFVINFA